MHQFKLQTFVYIQQKESPEEALLVFRKIFEDNYFSDKVPTIERTKRLGQFSVGFEFSADDADEAEKKADEIIQYFMRGLEESQPLPSVHRGSDKLAYA